MRAGEGKCYLGKWGEGEVEQEDVEEGGKKG